MRILLNRPKTIFYLLKEDYILVMYWARVMGGLLYGDPRAKKGLSRSLACGAWI